MRLLSLLSLFITSVKAHALHTTAKTAGFTSISNIFWKQLNYKPDHGQNKHTFHYFNTPNTISSILNLKFPAFCVKFFLIWFFY